MSARERPILFSAPMVRAILDGRKTQTRRIVKPRHKDGVITGLNPEGLPIESWGGGRGFRASYMEVMDPVFWVGDRLWVRETIRRGPPQGAGNDSAIYAADGTFTQLDTWPWKRDALSAIHCPRGLSRLVLEVTAVRGDRLQAITDEDARAEGCSQGDIPADEHGPRRIGWAPGPDDGKCILYPSPAEAFHVLWDSINGESAPWASNPLVWVVSFRRVEPA